MIDSLSKHEWAIMEALWDRSPLYLSELTDALTPHMTWKRGTYMTYLRRMIDKGYIDFTEVRGSRAYRPLIAREQCVRRESKEILSVLRGDSARLMLTCMIEEGGLDDADSEELMRLIDTLASRQKGG